MKKIFFGIGIFFFPIILFAQKDTDKKKKFVFNAGIENQLPVKTFKTFYNYGVGASFNAEYKTFKNFGFTFSPEYVRYLYNMHSLNISGSTGYLSFLAGAKYSLPYKTYILLQAGLSIKMVQDEANESAVAFDYGAGIYVTKKITAELKYLQIKTITTAPQVIDLRIAYEFGK